MKTIFLIQVSLLVFGFSGVCSAETTDASIYPDAQNRQKELFHLKRTETEQDNQMKIVASYTNPDGTEAVHEEAYLEGGLLKRYLQNRLQTKESGEIKVSGNKVLFSYTKGGKTETAQEDFPPNLVAGPTIVHYVANHWAEILKGDDVDIRYVAIDRKETVGFKLFKVGEGKKEGKEVVFVKMKPSSIIIAALVDPLLFTFEKPTKKVLELKGRTVPKVYKDGKWQDLDGDLVYKD